MAPSDHVPFTREDVERLKAIEISSGATAGALTALAEAVKVYEEAHSKLHEQLIKQTNDNAQFVRGFRTIRKVIFSLLMGSTGLWLLDNIAKAYGWIH